jgi:hypothetical protein
MERQTQVWHVRGRLGSDGTGTLKTNQLVGGQLLCIQLISVRNPDTKTPDFHIGVDRGGELYYIETKTPSGRGRAVRTKGPIWVPSDYQVRVDVSGGGDNDEVEMFVYGYLTNNAGE